ncbi:MAG TPA: hypothetical protein VMA36_20600 [Candidatus Limnocylindria bacterium]|nr:hypothetical protein [Candidatus Limnocylindria bacterium]
MDVTRALADLDEVRSRIASVQRVRGLSGAAALASGIGALGSGLVQLAVVPHPSGAEDGARYVAIWIACLAFALAINYGAIAVWLIRHWSARSQAELRTVGMTILPAIVAGGAFTAALLSRGEIGLLPGIWCTCYALGLLASRSMAPRGFVPVALAFAATGIALLFAPATNALAWWVMPMTFGLGQLVIAALIARDEFAREVRA